MQKKRIINLISYVLTFGLCAFLIWFSLKDVSDADIEKIKFSVSKANYFLLIPIVIMGVLSHWSRAVRWKYLMEPLQMYPSTRNTFLTVMIGYLANMFLPRFGEVIKCTLLAKYEKIPADKLIGTIITERAFDVLCLLLVFLITFIIQVDLAAEYLSTLAAKYNANASNGSSGWVLISIIAFLVILFLFRNTIRQFSLFIKLRQIVKNVLAGIMSFRNMKNKKGFVFHTILIWSLYLGMIVLGFKSIPETSILGFKTGFSVLSFGSIGMIVTPGGMGAYTLLVNEIVSLYGIEKAMSLAISWIIWLVPTIIILIGGSISLLLIPILNNTKSNAHETRNYTE
ncbi:MAG: flippase-like domain-containing protein [Bacteroidetes bacterium]|nr:flippase-like domain-containing protein [Bacteroidota bacterium]